MKDDQLKKIKMQCQQESKEPIVFGEGNLDPLMMLVGEAPGAREIESGKPFVGQAGKNLNQFLEILNFQREEIYITNVVKIRPYKINEKTGKKINRPPNKAEIADYKKYLYEEIKIIQPKIIVTLGNVALKVLFHDNHVKIGDMHGKLMKKDGFYIFPLYHPASIIYRKALKQIYLEDLYKLKEACVNRDRIKLV